MSGERPTNGIEKTLDYVGLLGPLKVFPGQLVVAVFSIVFVEAVYLSLGIPDDVIGGLNQHLIVVILGVLVGVIGYTAGNFWDRVVFDRLYGLNGTRLGKPASTFFPSGIDLAAARNRAVSTLHGEIKSARGIYRDCKDVVEAEPSKWKVVEEPILLSKVARAFIWPCVLAGIGCGIGFLVGPSLSWQLAPVSLLVIAVTSMCFAILLFIPYLNLRVEHMIRLYRTATQMRSPSSS